jgi:glycerophosphoryl diester phosphodiesterase
MRFLNLNLKISIVITVLIVCFLTSCSKIKYYPDKDYSEVKTKIIAHRAGGGYPSLYMEYSLEAAKNSFPAVDGIEVDLQLSKDRTIWLCHDAELSECGGNSYNCFPESHDTQIVELDSCNGSTVNFTRLEDIFILMASQYKDKHISLDVKAWSPCAGTSAYIIGEMNVIGDEIIQLTNKYSLQNCVMVESETATFLDYVKKHGSGIECYLTSLGDFERAMQLCLESGYTGISFKYKFKEEITVDHIQLIHRKGLKIQLWTVNSEHDLKEAMSINPDYIQTDNLQYFKQVK